MLTLKKESTCLKDEGFPGGSVVNNPSANVGEQVPSLVWEDNVEKEMVTHSSILACKIPWTEEPVG